MAFDAVRPAFELRAALTLHPVFARSDHFPSRVPTLDAAVVPLRHEGTAFPVVKATMTAHSRKPLPQRLGRAQVDVDQVPHALPVFHHPRKLKGTGGLRPCLEQLVLLADPPNVLQTVLVQRLHHSGLRHRAAPPTPASTRNLDE